MRRREVIALIAGAAAATPLAAVSQQTIKIPKIGVLWHAGSEQEEATYLGALRQGFHDLGYVEDKNLILVKLPQRTARSNVGYGQGASGRSG